MRRREVTRKEKVKAFSTKAKYKGIIAIDIIVSNLTKEVGDFSTMCASRAYSNRRSWENKCGHYKPKLTGRVCAKAQPICNRGRPRKKLLQLWGIWTYSEKFQKLENSRMREKS